VGKIGRKVKDLDPKTPLGKRLCEFIGLDNIPPLMEKLNISRGNIRGLLEGKADPGAGRLMDLLIAAGIAEHAGYILSGIGKEEVPTFALSPVRRMAISDTLSILEDVRGKLATMRGEIEHIEDYLDTVDVMIRTATDPDETGMRLVVAGVRALAEKKLNGDP
jgi:hypothetical protein